MQFKSVRVLDAVCFVLLFTALLWVFFVFLLQMDNTEKSPVEEGNSATCDNLENILQKLENLSNYMDQLACMYHTGSKQSVKHSPPPKKRVE